MCARAQRKEGGVLSQVFIEGLAGNNNFDGLRISLWLWVFREMFS